jgi:uncharacterized membrane protein
VDRAVVIGASSVARAVSRNTQLDRCSNARIAGFELDQWRESPGQQPLPQGNHVEGGGVMGLIIGLLVLWLVLIVIGFTIKALLWLAIVGLVFFVATAVFGAVRGRALR